MHNPLQEIFPQIYAYARATVRSLEPGGGYVGIWCRDAAFILRAMAKLGYSKECINGLSSIWSNQIQSNSKVTYGRGSPSTGFKAKRAEPENLRLWHGALPTTVLKHQTEIYGAEPDVDSNALLISATCDLLANLDPSSLNRLISKIDKTMNYLSGRAEPETMLIAQNPNEDWMDNAMRSGRVLYTQGVWAKALASYGNALQKVGKKNEADAAFNNLGKLINALNHLLKSEITRWASGHHVYQDVAYVLQVEGLDTKVAIDTLRILRERTRRTLGPAVVDPPLSETFPLKTDVATYQNGGFWPWATSEEILAKLRLGFIDEAIALFRACIPFFAVEWIEPTTGKKQGRYPFRTGISAFLEASSALQLALDTRIPKPA